MKHCYKIVRGTNYDKAVKKHFKQRELWKDVFLKVSELLGEKISKMAFVTNELWIDTTELTDSENKKLFSKDGKLKNNSKRAKEIREKYIQIINEAGLSDFQELRNINFAYGVMRMQGQNLESFVTSEYDIYYKAQRCKGLVEPITEIEYEEKYLEELKKNQ